MFGFVSIVKYNHIVKLRNEIFLEKEEIKHRCKMEIEKKDLEIRQKDEKIEQYKKMYLDELQKRLDLAKWISEMSL